MSFLLLNSGSSSLKVTLVDSANGSTLARGLVDWSALSPRYEFSSVNQRTAKAGFVCRTHADAVRFFFTRLKENGPKDLGAEAKVEGVGHRIVHGGSFTSSIRITPEVRMQISALSAVAPLHNPPSLEALQVAEAEMPDVPHIAVFDTSFHTTLPSAAKVYPVPFQWTADYGIRRYGFHGLSYAYCTGRAAEMLNRPAESLRLVICHLGNGCSASAVYHGRSISTTMGLTPLEGLMMGTRCGSIDPSIVLDMQLRHGMSAADLETTLNRQSGLLGVSQVSADVRQVQAAADSGNDQARLALEIYSDRIRQAVGALAVTMGGVDALIFTAGVGEHSASVREAACNGLECLRLNLDTERNASAVPDTDLSTTSSEGRILVIHTREDITMFREMKKVLAAEDAVPV